MRTTASSERTESRYSPTAGWVDRSPVVTPMKLGTQDLMGELSTSFATDAGRYGRASRLWVKEQRAIAELNGREAHLKSGRHSSTEETTTLAGGRRASLD